MSSQHTFSLVWVGWYHRGQVWLYRSLPHFTIHTHLTHTHNVGTHLPWCCQCRPHHITVDLAQFLSGRMELQALYLNVSLPCLAETVVIGPYNMVPAVFTCMNSALVNEVILIWSISCKHHETSKLKPSAIPSASTTTRAWRTVWPPMLPSHHYPWGKWAPCLRRYLAPPTQVEANPQMKVPTPGLAREEPQGSSSPHQLQRPPALHPSLPASHRRHRLRTTRTLRWRLKWRAGMNVS